MIIAWDFDGVLNRNQIGGRYVWEDDFARQVGQPASAFGSFVFGQAPYVIKGELDILERLKEWTDSVECRMSAEAILTYWLQQDACPDSQMLALVDAMHETGTRQIIATNNDPRRADYIATEMGMSRRVEHIFASGKMGLAKPDGGYYRHITDALEVDPAEMFFVDDLKANVDAAVAQGWQAFHFTPESRDTLIAKLQP